MEPRAQPQQPCSTLGHGYRDPLPRPSRQQQGGREAPVTHHLEVWAINTKDFHSLLSDGELAKFPDWPQRTMAKLSKAHPRTEELLKWAEQQAQPITRSDDCELSLACFDVSAVSCAVFEVLLERSGPPLICQDRSSGRGRPAGSWGRVRLRGQEQDSQHGRDTRTNHGSRARASSSR